MYLSLSLSSSFSFFGHVMFSYDSNQFCRVSVWSGRPEGFESNTITQSMTKVGLD